MTCSSVIKSGFSTYTYCSSTYSQYYCRSRTIIAICISNKHLAITQCCRRYIICIPSIKYGFSTCAYCCTVYGQCYCCSIIRIVAVPISNKHFAIAQCYRRYISCNSVIKCALINFALYKLYKIARVDVSARIDDIFVDYSVYV